MFSSESSAVCEHHARILRELETVQGQNEPVVNLNYQKLTVLPDVLLDNSYCQSKLHRLYLKRNCITSLVRAR